LFACFFTGVSLGETHHIREDGGMIRFLLLSPEEGQQRAARDMDKIMTLIFKFTSNLKLMSSAATTLGLERKDRFQILSPVTNTVLSSCFCTLVMIEMKKKKSAQKQLNHISM